MDISAFIPAPELVRRWRCSRKLIKGLIESKRLIAIKPGKVWLVTPESVAAHEARIFAPLKADA